MAGERTAGLRRGNKGNRGGGRPPDRFRRMATEHVEDWLSRASRLLEEMDRASKTFDEKLRVVEAAGRLADRFGRYTGLDKAEIIRIDQRPIRVDFGGMSLEERKELLASLEK